MIPFARSASAGSLLLLPSVEPACAPHRLHRLRRSCTPADSAPVRSARIARRFRQLLRFGNHPSFLGLIPFAGSASAGSLLFRLQGNLPVHSRLQLAFRRLHSQPPASAPVADCPSGSIPAPRPPLDRAHSGKPFPFRCAPRQRIPCVRFPPLRLLRPPVPCSAWVPTLRGLRISPWLRSVPDVLRRLRFQRPAPLPSGQSASAPLQRYARRFRHGPPAAPCHFGVLSRFRASPAKNPFRAHSAPPARPAHARVCSAPALAAARHMRRLLPPNLRELRVGTLAPQQPCVRLRPPLNYSRPPRLRSIPQVRALPARRLAEKAASCSFPLRLPLVFSSSRCVPAGALQIIGKDSLQNIHSEKSLSAVQSVHNRCGFKPFKQAGERCVSRFRRQSCTNCSFSCLFYSSVSFLVTERNSSISSTVLQWSGELRTIPSVLNSPTCLE